MNLEHGGNTRAAALQFDIPHEKWLDLSTGISPWSWPVPQVPGSVWQALPQADGQLERVAARYYGCTPESLLAVPGSQYALQHLPALLPRGRVAMPVRGYAEHRQAWANAGHLIVDYSGAAGLRRCIEQGEVDHAVLINPNNPTGDYLSVDAVMHLVQRLRERNGCLVVDEAFADVFEDTLAARCPHPGLVVFRSVGKFFGLAGLRLGFMSASVELCAALAATMSPWMVSHPARWIGERALADDFWQQQQRERLQVHSQQWQESLAQSLPGYSLAATPLFVTATGGEGDCAALYEALAHRAILVRQFESIEGQGMLRLGLPLEQDRGRVLQAIYQAVGESQCGVA